MPRTGSVWDESVLRVPNPASVRSYCSTLAGSIWLIIAVISASSRLGPTTGWLGGFGGWSSSLRAPTAYAPAARAATANRATATAVRLLMDPPLCVAELAADSPAGELGGGSLPDL